MAESVAFSKIFQQNVDRMPANRKGGAGSVTIHQCVLMSMTLRKCWLRITLPPKTNSNKFEMLLWMLKGKGLVGNLVQYLTYIRRCLRSLRIVENWAVRNLNMPWEMQDFIEIEVLSSPSCEKRCISTGHSYGEVNRQAHQVLFIISPVFPSATWNNFFSNIHLRRCTSSY